MCTVSGCGDYDAVYSGKPQDRENELVWTGSNSSPQSRWTSFGSYLGEWWQPVLRQVKASTCSIDIRQEQGSAGCYYLDFYRADQIAQKQSGTYDFSGKTPIESWTVTNAGNKSDASWMKIATPSATYYLKRTSTTSQDPQSWTFTVYDNTGNGGYLTKQWTCQTTDGHPTTTENTIVDGVALPTVTASYYSMPTYPFQIKEEGDDGTRTTQFTYKWSGTNGLSSIDHLIQIQQVGGPNPYTATYDEHELLTSYVCGSSSTQVTYGYAVTRTDSFGGQPVRTLQTVYTKGLTSAETTASGVTGAATAKTTLYSGTDQTYPW
jgi:hypothetical protein